MKYHVEKSTLINADMARVRELTEDFREWKSWSPWNIVEPECPMEFSGTPREVGSEMSWDGEIIGSGKNVLAEKTDDALRYDLFFYKPWKSEAKTALVFEQQDDGVKVTWTLDSSMPFFLFFMVDMMKNWIGMDYDRGLRMLKEVAEKGSVNATTANKGIVDLEGFSYVGLKRTVPFEDLPKMMEDFDKILKDIVMDGGKSAEHWVTLYPKMDMKNMQMTYIAAVSDEGLGDLEIGDEYVRGTIDSSKALEILHEGSYDFLGNAWSMGMMTMQSKKMKKSGVPFERYWNSPKETAPEDLKTSIYFPVKS